MTDTRGDFERYFALTIRQQRRNANGHYCYIDVQARWEGWQAREQLVTAAPGDLAQIAHEVHNKCMRIPGANFYTAAEMAIDAAMK